MSPTDIKLLRDRPISISAYPLAHIKEHQIPQRYREIFTLPDESVEICRANLKIVGS